jgi:beta-phosphoglucomutase
VSAGVGVIFDMDGVLVDSGAAHAASWRALAREAGVTIGDPEFARHFGKASRDIIRAVFGEHLSDADVAAKDERKEALYRDSIRGRVPAMPGAVQAVTRLAAAGVAIAVGTSGPKENVDLVLDGLALREFFSAVVTGSDVRRGKPAPDVFLLAAERLGLQPASCIVVEDAPVGLQAARAAGMIAVGLTGTHPAERLTDADHVITTLDTLTPAWLTVKMKR